MESMAAKRIAEELEIELGELRRDLYQAMALEAAAIVGAVVGITVAGLGRIAMQDSAVVAPGRACRADVTPAAAAGRGRFLPGVRGGSRSGGGRSGG